MKMVHVIEKKSGRVAASVPLNLQGQNYDPTARQFEDVAWTCAIDDKLVNPKRRVDYSFKITEVLLKL